MPLAGAVGVTLAALWPLAAAVARGPQDAPPKWLKGPAFRQKLAQAEDVYWPAVPLRQALSQFSRAERVALVIDRRIDPGREIHLRLQSAPIIEIFRTVAKGGKAGISVFGPVIYLGPPHSADRIRTVAQLRRDEAAGLPSVAQRKWLEAKPLAWDDFATPRALLARLASQAGATITELEQVPHDLWAAADLPALPLTDRLTLILEQFDLTFRLAADGRSVELVPVPEEVGLVRRYPAGGRADQLASRWKELAPRCRFKVVGDEVYVCGRLEDHERIAAAGRPAGGDRHPGRKPSHGPAQKRFTARVQNKPLGQVLDSFAAQLKLEVKLDRAALAAAGVSLDQLVSFDVQQATLEELFRAILDPLDCEARFRDRVVEIRPAR